MNDKTRTNKRQDKLKEQVDHPEKVTATAVGRRRYGGVFKLRPKKNGGRRR